MLLMSAAHLHLVLNHAPLFGVMFAALGLAWAFAFRNASVGRASLSLLALAGVLVLPVYLSGERAEEVVEHRAGVSERVVGAHEDAALGAAIAVGAAGAVALLVLLGFRTRPLPRTVTAAVLALAVGAAVWVGYVANLGGRISHPELRTEASDVSISPSDRLPPAARERYEDDD